MFMITYVLNGVKNSKCVMCSAIETAIESIDEDAKILDWEKLY